MSLSIFTIDDRLKLVTALQLPSFELEEGSRLYAALDRLEERDRRLGLDRSPDVRGMADRIIALEEALVTERSQSDYGVSRIRVETYQEEELELEYPDGATSDVGLKKRLGKLRRDLKRTLDYYPQNMIMLG